MKRSAYSFLPFLACLFLWTSCANVTHPTGGEKDIRAPRLLSIHPKDSQLNTRVTRIEMQFDEFVTVSNASTEVKTLPILPFPISTVAKNKKVIVKIPDSLLKDRTTYRISFGNAIADVHENNVFKSYEYVFSTGSYFDSMKIGGSVLNAATGEKDSSAIILLYSSSRSDSEVLREKPDYYVKASATGDFIFYGLPNRPFKMIALRDADANLLYDGEKEWIGFTSKIITPIDSLNEKNVFDIAISSLADTVTTSVSLQTSNRPGGKNTTSNPEEVKPNHPTSSEDQDFTYSVSVDTFNHKKRTKDITTALEILFNKPIKLVNPNRINLSYDSLGTLVEANFKQEIDTIQKNKLRLQTHWAPNQVYTLRLLKNFALDSNNKEAMPSKYLFRTKMDDDYAKLKVHLPTMYLDSQYLFVLIRDKQVIFEKPVTDTLIHFNQLQPATYTLRIIKDENRNGKWDPGNYWTKKQPEKVFPHATTIPLKVGWENIVDFEPMTFTTPNFIIKQPLINNNKKKKE